MQPNERHSTRSIYLFLVMTYYVRTDDTFIAFDCTEPQNTEFFDHKICHKHSDRLVKQEFVIVQAKMVEKITGHMCERTITAQAGYCGRYSHDKFTGEDRFDTPIIFTQEAYRRMIEEETS